MLRLEFWLPLPLLGLAFWLVSGLMTDRSLQHSQLPVESYQITTNTEQPEDRVLWIKVIRDSDRNMSQIKVKRATQVYEQQDWAIATTDLVEIETTISQKLDLPLDRVNQLLRYQTKK